MKNRVKELKLDFENKSVSWECESFEIKNIDKYYKFSARNVINILTHQLELPYAVVQAFKDFNKKTGYNAKYIAKCLNWGCYQVFIKPIEQYVNDYAYCHYKGLIPFRVERIWKMKSILDRNKKDGIENISPFCFQYEMTPKELKEAFGKGLWKKLTKNSKYRNNILRRRLHPSAKHLGQKYFDQVPSSYYKKFSSNYYAYYFWKNKIPKSDWERMKMEIGDLPRSTELKWLNWTPRRIHEEHEKMIREQTNRRLRGRSPKTFEIFKKNKEYPKTVESDGFKAELLTSALDLAKEGIEMKHCVGSYDYHVKNGQYIIYSISGKERSTLSISVGEKQYEIDTTGAVWSKDRNFNDWGQFAKINQHYSYCNSKVSKESEKFAKKIESQWLEYLSQRRADNHNINASLIHA